MSLDKQSVSDAAIASESEDETVFDTNATPAPGPFNRSRGSRDSNQSTRPMKRRESNVDIDSIHEFLQSDEISPAQLYATDNGQLFHAGKLCVVMVGLPARGKTHHTVALTRYLRWLGVKTHAFHLGDYRRKLGNLYFKVPDDYFLPEPSQSTVLLRKKVLDACMDDIFSFYQDGGQVAIYDAINSSASVRNDLVKLFSAKNINVLFVECVALDDHLVARNVRDVRMTSPDFQGMNYKDAVKSYLRRIELRAPYYEPMGPSENEHSYIKLINGVDQIQMNRAPIGYLQNRIVFYLMNAHIKPGNYYFARAGQSDESELMYRDDGSLSEKGHEYAKKLKQTLLDHLETQHLAMASGASTLTYATPTLTKSYTNSEESSLSAETIAKRLAETKIQGVGTDEFNNRPTFAALRKAARVIEPEWQSLTVWSSKRIRTVETAQYFAKEGVVCTSRSELTQMNPGDVDGLSEDEIKKKYSEEYESQLANPYHHRYPRSESYHDVAVRLEPLIMEMERHTGDLLIIAHESVLVLLYGYLMACSVEDIPFLKFPRNEIVEIKPGAYYNTATRISLEGIDP